MTILPVASVLQSSTTINSEPGIFAITSSYHSRTHASMISASFQAGMTILTMIYLAPAAADRRLLASLGWLSVISSPACARRFTNSTPCIKL